MIKFYSLLMRVTTVLLLFTIFFASCKKDSITKTNVVKPPVVATNPLAVLGLIEYQSTIYRRVFLPITQIGTKTVEYYTVFDTGSSAMTMDATDVIPASMITSAGITVAGDSVVTNGITITNKTAIIEYGDATDGTKEYGNLAYATVKIGDANGSITTKRIPFFLYYKAVDSKSGDVLDAHSNDVFGVGPETSFSRLTMASPLSYLTGTGITPGFKLAPFSDAGFTSDGTNVPGLLTIGLLASDVAPSSPFVMHLLDFEGSAYGYSPIITSTITYNAKSITSAKLLFDTGNPAYANIEDSNASPTITTLPDSSTVKISTNSGFNYTYITKSDYNLTQIINPSVSQDSRSIFSIYFFSGNSFLLDYTDHLIGLKNK